MGCWGVIRGGGVGHGWGLRSWFSVISNIFEKTK